MRWLGASLDRLVTATPATRDRTVDALRARWIQRPLWLVLPAVVLALLVAVFAPAETRSRSHSR